MADQNSQHGMPHFVLVPMMAPGHMIPMVDMACLLACRGVLVSLVTTPANASRIPDRFHQSSTPPPRLLILPFPCREAGLPEGCESVDALPSRDFILNFVQAATMLREPLASRLREQHHPSPSCIISDSLHFWTRDVAREFGIPWITFTGCGCFSLLIRHIIRRDHIFDNTEDGSIIVVPGLPHQIEIAKDHVPGGVAGPEFDKLRQEIMRVEETADGVVVNSFDRLEPVYRDLYQKSVGKKVWTIGPTLAPITNKSAASMEEKGQCLTWLDSMKPGSVLYVSFGSMARSTLSQLIEIGLGLEASGCPFIWAIKAAHKYSSEVEDWLSDSGFEERMSGRGLVIRGWVPQVMVLSHPAVGGFLTHCGWNSTLESVTAGVPMITWPHFAEQFLNEKLVVLVLKIGVAVGVKSRTGWGVDEGDLVSIKRGEVETAVSRLMGDGEEGKEMRRRVAELGKMARTAMEPGGTSFEHLRDLIQYAQKNVSEENEYEREGICF